MTSDIDRGKLQLSIKPEKVEVEEEIQQLFQRIMADYNDSVISPLSYFSSQSEGEKGEMVGTKHLSERKRRIQVNEYYSALDSMIPDYVKTAKRSRVNIVDDTVKYVKQLEEELEMLEVLKKSRLEKPVMTSNCVLSKCAYQNVANAATFFAIQRPFRRGLVQDIVKVLEKHQVEVLETRFRVDEQKTVTFNATIVVGSGGAGTIDKIKEEVLIL